MSALTFAVLGLIAWFLYQYFANKPRNDLPPGPKPLPIIGNAWEFPPPGTVEYQHWGRHRDLYGPISSISALGHTLVIVHDKKLAAELLESASARTSDRPASETSTALRRRAAIMPNLPNDSTLRRLRALFHQQMGTGKLVERFQETQEVESRRLLQRALNQPECLLDNIRFFAKATILNMTYGYLPKTDEPDSLVDRIERLVEQIIEILTPGTWLVDIFPMIKYLPRGFPGTGFAKAVEVVANDWAEMMDIPYNLVREQMKDGVHNTSFVSKAIEDRIDNGKQSRSCKEEQEEEHAIKATAAVMYSGAVETTTSTLTVLILAMVKFPEVQRKAQEEIDRVVGTDRLPGFQDQQSLPYVEAVVTETLRWCPSFPMGLPHTTSHDLAAGGYLIPKGASIMPAVYWFTHDPEVHKEPDVFDPERYMAPRNEPDPRQVVFGYGRRICPGRHFADASLYIAAVRLLAAFKLSNEVDDNGNPIVPDLCPRPGVTIRLGAFPFKIASRSERHAELIRTVSKAE